MGSVLVDVLWTTAIETLPEHVPPSHISLGVTNLNRGTTRKQAWLARRRLTRRRFVFLTMESRCSDKGCDWLSSANVARDRQHSPPLGNNYPSLHAGCQRANSSVIIPLLPVESDWQRAQYQSHSITLVLAFISSTLSSTMKAAGFYFTLKTNVSPCSAPALLHWEFNTWRCNRKLDNFNQFNLVGSTSGFTFTKAFCCIFNKFGVEELQQAEDNTSDILFTYYRRRFGATW